MTKNNPEFQEFLRDHVNLNPSRLDRLESGVRGVNGHLKDHLPGYQNMERQGSYALGTLIKPVGEYDEYDADIQIVMNHNPKWKPLDYINAIYDTLKENQTYADKIKRGTRCVTVEYVGDFHLDVVPRVTINGRYYVCNRKENEFEETDGNGYRDWFNKQNQITEGHLKRVVRLLKYLRDHKKNYTAKSILLTTLVGNTIKPSDEGTEAVATIADTLETVLTRMDDYLQKHSTMPEIRNPVLPSETFNRHWDQTMYSNFRTRVHSHAQTAKDAKATASSQNAIKIWRQLFGDDFGKGSSGGGGNGGGDNSPGIPSGSHGSNRPLLAAPRNTCEAKTTIRGHTCTGKWRSRISNCPDVGQRHSTRRPGTTRPIIRRQKSSNHRNTGILGGVRPKRRMANLHVGLNCSRQRESHSRYFRNRDTP